MSKNVTKPPRIALAGIALAVAALGVELSADQAPVDVRMIPAGEFRSKDGRPTECPCWVMTQEDGERIAAEAAAALSPMVIDYEHATLHAKKTGVKAVASGWFKQLEWRDDGLWAIGVDWTALADQEIVGKLYRFISPVFSYDKTTGRVLKLFHAALTNDPALDGLTDLAVLAADFFLNSTQPTEVSAVNEELLEQLRWLLNLPVGSTAEEIATHLSKIIDQIRGGDATAAASFDLSAHLVSQAESIAALTAKVAEPDPALFVPIAALSASQAENADLQVKVAALSATVDQGEIDKLINAASDEGKLTPATSAWAREHFKSNVAALSSFLAAAPVVVALGETQTGGKKPTGQLDTDDSQAIASAALSFQQEQAGKGINISTVQAVAHVSKKEG